MEVNMYLPQDAMILLSAVNTKLRDFYPSLKAMCEDMNVSESEIKSKLEGIGYEYSEELNRFV